MFSKLAVKHNLCMSYVLTGLSRFSSDCSGPPSSFKQGFTVTILDAAQNIGRNAAILLKQNSLIKELRLYDKNSSICVVAEDLSYIDTRTKVKSYCGTSVLKDAVSNADVVISLGGCRKKVSECSTHLFEKNLDDMRAHALHCIEFSPTAILCIAKPPIEAFVPLVSEEYKRAGLYDHRKIIGMSSIGCMRANYMTSVISAQNASEVRCPIVGGISKNCLVACVSQSRPAKIHPQHHKIIQDSVVIAEDELIKLFGEKEIVCLAPALAISRFVTSQLKALSGETNCVDCAFVKQTGHIGQFLPYMTSIVRLGRHGILSTHMPKINGIEAHCLKRAAMFIKENIKLGESFVVGERKVVKELKEEKKVVKRI